MTDRFVFGFSDGLTALGGFDPGLPDCLIVDLRRQLLLLFPPELSYDGFQILVLSRRASHHGVAQGGPGRGNAEKDEDDGCHSREHSSSSGNRQDLQDLLDWFSSSPSSKSCKSCLFQ